MTEAADDRKSRPGLYRGKARTGGAARRRAESRMGETGLSPEIKDTGRPVVWTYSEYVYNHPWAGIGRFDCINWTPHLKHLLGFEKSKSVVVLESVWYGIYIRSCGTSVLGDGSATASP